MESEKRILDAARSRMLKFGYRKVTMDEIAQDLAMSKNTIYKHFRSKKQIAMVLFDRLSREINNRQTHLERQYQDPLEIIQHNVLFMQKTLGPWFEDFLPDIKQELPDLWRSFVAFRTEKILEVEKLVKDGIQKGLFRRVNSMIAVRVFLGAIDEIISPEVLQHENISFDKALNEVLDIWSGGILKKDKEPK